MLLGLLPLVAASIATPDDTVVTTSPRAAQVRLADMLSNADSIDAVFAHHHTFTFVIDRGDDSFEIVATTGGDGNVLDVVEHDRAHGELDLGGLSWLADTMKQANAVTNLTVDEDGAVTLTTSEGARFMAIPGRGSGGNAEVEARWAAEFDSESSS